MRARDSERTGAAIRKLRLARGWTLAELSVEAGIPLSTLSRVELGQNALKYENLMRLCRALGVDLQGLVAREADTVSAASGRRSVTRAGAGRSVRLGGQTGKLAADDLTERALTPIVLEVTASSLAEHGPLVSLQSEAHMLVLHGAVVLHSQFYAPLELAAGDGVYFDARAGFAVLAADAKGARALLTLAGDVDLGG
jgi:transcriptional regulator with XRE-family HTH domain